MANESVPRKKGSGPPLKVEKNFTKVQNVVIDSYNLPAIELKVYLILARKAGVKGECWPSVRTLAQLAGLRIRRTQVATANLEQLGLIRKHYRFGSNIYELVNLQSVHNNAPQGAQRNTPYNSENIEADIDDMPF